MHALEAEPRHATIAARARQLAMFVGTGRAADTHTPAHAAPRVPCRMAQAYKDLQAENVEMMALLEDTQATYATAMEHMQKKHDVRTGGARAAPRPAHGESGVHPVHHVCTMCLLANRRLALDHDVCVERCRFPPPRHNGVFCVWCMAHGPPRPMRGSSSRSKRPSAHACMRVRVTPALRLSARCVHDDAADPDTVCVAHGRGWSTPMLAHI